MVSDEDTGGEDVVAQDPPMQDDHLEKNLARAVLTVVDLKKWFDDLYMGKWKFSKSVSGYIFISYIPTVSY